MKNLFLVLTVMLFSLTTFTSCKKESPQQLSEFVIGDWSTRSTYLNIKVASSGSAIAITSVHYIIYKTYESRDPIMDSQGSYTIDEKDSTIEMDSQGDPIMYDITWLEDGNTMTWTENRISLIRKDGPQVIIWTKD